MCLPLPLPDTHPGPGCFQHSKVQSPRFLLQVLSLYTTAFRHSEAASVWSEPPRAQAQPHCQHRSTVQGNTTWPANSSILWLLPPTYVQFTCFRYSPYLETSDPRSNFHAHSYKLHPAEGSALADQKLTARALNLCRIDSFPFRHFLLIFHLLYFIPLPFQAIAVLRSRSSSSSDLPAWLCIDVDSLSRKLPPLSAAHFFPASRYW